MHIKTPWYHGWNILAICVLAQMASLGVMANCFSFFLEGWSKEFNVQISTLVLAITLFSVVASLTSPLCGWIVSRVPVKRVMISGMLGIVLGHVLIGFASSGWQIIGIYMLVFPLAVSFGGGVSTQSLVSRWFVRRRGFAFSICALGLVAAGVIFPPMVVWLLGMVGWRETWWIFAALYFVVVISLMLLVLRERPEPEEGRYYIIDDASGQQGEGRAALSVRQILSRRNFWLTIAVFVPIVLANSALSINFAPFVHERGLSTGEAALLIAIFNGAAAVGKLSAGSLADRFGNRVPLFLLSTTATVGIVSLIFLTGLWPITLGFVLLGLGQGMWVLLASCIASEYGAADFPRAFGIANVSSVLTTLAAPALALVAERTHSYTMGLAIFGALGVISIVASLFFVERGRAGKPFTTLAEQTAADRVP